MKIKEGQKYIVRSVEAGVFYGEITAQDGNEVTMKNARCLWYWSGAASLNQLARDGVKKPRECKFTVAADELVLLNACEIIPCSDEAANCIDGVAEWKM